MVEISRYTYYRMRRRGEGPRETRVTPRRAVIMLASIDEWFAKRQQDEAHEEVKDAQPALQQDMQPATAGKKKRVVRKK